MAKETLQVTRWRKRLIQAFEVQASHSLWRPQILVALGKPSIPRAAFEALLVSLVADGTLTTLKGLYNKRKSTLFVLGLSNQPLC